MKKINILWIMIFILPVVLASGDIESYLPKEKIPLSVHLSNISGDVTGANCSIQLLNSTFNVTLNGQMNEMIGGWYNFTYNTSKIGYYYCRQNCTLGNSYTSETCDFVIQGEDTMILGILMVVLALIAYFLIVMYLLNENTFAKHGMIKLVLIMGLTWFILFPINMAILYNDYFGGPSSVTSNLSTIYQIAIWVNYFFSFYVIIYFIIEIINKLRGNKVKTQ